jgi:hypothetical protein
LNVLLFLCLKTSLKCKRLINGKLLDRGDFEEGYRSGFDDASKLGSGAAARERMDHE